MLRSLSISVIIYTDTAPFQAVRLGDLCGVIYAYHKYLNSTTGTKSHQEEDRSGTTQVTKPNMSKIVYDMHKLVP